MKTQRQTGSSLVIDLTRFPDGIPTMTREGFQLEGLGKELQNYLRPLRQEKVIDPVCYTHNYVGYVTSAHVNTINPRIARMITSAVIHMGAFVQSGSHQPES